MANALSYTAHRRLAVDRRVARCGDDLMKELWQENSVQIAETAVPDTILPLHNRERSPTWGQYAWLVAWLVAIPLALIVTYAFVPILDNGFVRSLDDRGNFLRTALSVVWARTR